VTRALAALFVAAVSAAGADAAQFRDRARTVVEFYAHPKDPAATGLATIAGKLALKEDPKWCSRRLIELLAGEQTGDMFWMFPVTAIAYLDKGQLSDPARAALRNAWKTYMPYRGDTENHWLLYYTCLYLMAQLWPDQPGDTWYTGKTSEENFAEARAWIESWVRLTTRRGQGEYDSTHYLGVYVLPMYI